jgi:pimeloyl-ACP methyl ester carboxylesterase
LNLIKKDFPDLQFILSEEKTPDNRILPTITIQPLTEKKKDTILIFNGQNATFRNEKKIRTYCQLVRDTDCTVVSFDYGGTALRRITTWTQKPLVNDGVFLAKKLANLLPDSSNLILKGHSLGGAIATLTAEKCHEANILAYLWNGRSFLSVVDVVAGHIRTLHKSGHYENNATIFLSKASRPFISTLLYVSGWNIDVEQAYKAIPESYKNYYLVRSNKNQRLSKKDDLVIPYCASLEASPDIKLLVKQLINVGDKDNSEDIAFYRARRKCFSDSSQNAHPTPEINLYCRVNPQLSAYKLFCLFTTSYIPKQIITKERIILNKMACSERGVHI